MAMFTIGQAVVVTDRRDLYAYEEGTVFRGSLDAHHVGVHFPTIEGEAQPDGDVRDVHADALAPLPRVGERRRWNTSRVLRGAGPFVVTRRRDDAERLFVLDYGKGGSLQVASAAELAGFSELVTEPDGADDGTTAEARAAVTRPRNGAATLDTLRDAVLEAALQWHEDDRRGKDVYVARRRRIELADAVQAYRTARDS